MYHTREVSDHKATHTPLNGGEGASQGAGLNVVKCQKRTFRYSGEQGYLHGAVPESEGWLTPSIRK